LLLHSLLKAAPSSNRSAVNLQRQNTQLNPLILVSYEKKARGVVFRSCSGKEGESARLGRWIYDHFRTSYLNQLPVGAMLINAGSSDDRKAYVLKRGRARPKTDYPDLAAKIFLWVKEALAYIKMVRLSLFSKTIEESGVSPKLSSSTP
jgi:hypothetical protein